MLVINGSFVAAGAVKGFLVGKAVPKDVVAAGTLSELVNAGFIWRDCVIPLQSDVMNPEVDGSRRR